MNDPSNPTLREAASVASLADEMARTVVANCDAERVSLAVQAFTNALRPRGNNSDALMALGAMVAAHAHLAAEDCGTDPTRTLSVIATAIGMIAQRTTPVATPTDPKQIN